MADTKVMALTARFDALPAAVRASLLINVSGTASYVDRMLAKAERAGWGKGIEAAASLLIAARTPGGERGPEAKDPVASAIEGDRMRLRYGIVSNRSLARDGITIADGDEVHERTGSAGTFAEHVQTERKRSDDEIARAKADPGMHADAVGRAGRLLRERDRNSREGGQLGFCGLDWRLPSSNDDDRDDGDDDDGEVAA